MKRYYAAGAAITNSHDQSWKIHILLPQPADQTFDSNVTTPFPELVLPTTYLQILVVEIHFLFM